MSDSEYIIPRKTNNLMLIIIENLEYCSNLTSEVKNNVGDFKKGLINKEEFIKNLEKIKPIILIGVGL